MKVTTAVILAASFGSRMLPISAAVQKELMPILDRPIIDYLVEDCLNAGVTRIIFIVKPGSDALRRYFFGYPELDQYLNHGGKTKQLNELREIRSRATYVFIEQPPEAGLGTATAISLAKNLLHDNEAFIVSTGDDFLWRPDGGSEFAELVKTYEQSNAAGALMALQRPDEELHRYGVLGVTGEPGEERLRHLVEKPAPGQAPSNLINISKYIFTPQLFKYIEAVKPNPVTHEAYITDAIDAAAQDHHIAVHRAQGEFLDAGNLNGWLEANLIVSRSRSDVLPKLQEFLHTFKQ